ncbi:MAG TPA: hypothetical protein VMT30_02700 [Candidatus Saccharimonadia bacterium]|nr:hypothetical protein [Candidatus Saccharimonadia bacterium]
MKPTNPDGSPLEILNFVRIVHWSGDDLKTLEAWTGYEWSRKSVGPTSAWANVRDLIIQVDNISAAAGQETRWGSPIIRDSNTGVEVTPTPDPNTSHLPAGERIGQVAIERHHGPKATDPVYFDVHLWNGFGWVNVGPGHFSDEKTATLFANKLTGKFDEASVGGLCHMGHDFACRQCGARRPEAPALAGEAPETCAEIMEGAFRITVDPHHADRFSVTRWDGEVWSSVLIACEPELWPWRQFPSEAEAETAILQYGHRVGETVTLVRNDGAEIVSVAPGAGSFPREHTADELFSRDQVRDLATAIMDFQRQGERIELKVAGHTGDMPAPPAPASTVFRIRPDLTSITKQWRIQGRQVSGCEWVEMFEPCASYWIAFNVIQKTENFNLENPSIEDLNHWARQGFHIDPPVLIPAVPPVALGTPTPVGECRMITGSAGDCWNVERWTGHEWKNIARDVTKRTAETIIRARKANPDKNPGFAPWNVEQRIKCLHSTFVERNQSECKLDAETFISKIFKEIEEIIENNY